MAETKRTHKTMVEDALEDVRSARREAGVRIINLEARYGRFNRAAESYRWLMRLTDNELRLDPNKRYQTLGYSMRPCEAYSSHDPVTIILDGIQREEKKSAAPFHYHRNPEKARLAYELAGQIDKRKMPEQVYNSILDGTHTVFTTGFDEHPKERVKDSGEADV